MKFILHTILFLTIALSLDAQVFFNETKEYNKECDFVLIPSIHSGYSVHSGEFVAKNNGLMVDRRFILPEVYFGGQLMANGFMIGIHYGVLQSTILLGAGWSIPLKSKKKRKN